MPFKKKDKSNKWDKQKQCLSPSHNPPMHISLPPGEHTWICPSCGKETTFCVQGFIC